MPGVVRFIPQGLSIHIIMYNIKYRRSLLYCTFNMHGWRAVVSLDLIPLWLDTGDTPNIALNSFLSLPPHSLTHSLAHVILFPTCKFKINFDGPIGYWHIHSYSNNVHLMLEISTPSLPHGDRIFNVTIY